jgi:hypothetical protein
MADNFEAHMRDATEEERKSVKNYIKSISKPTGLRFDEAYEELDFIVPHKKLSVNLVAQLSEDCISRKAVEKLKKYRLSYDTNTTIPKTDIFVKLADIKQLPSVYPQRKQGRWIKRDDIITASFCSECSNGWSWETAYCPNCGAKMGGDANDNS